MMGSLSHLLFDDYEYNENYPHHDYYRYHSGHYDNSYVYVLPLL